MARYKVTIQETSTYEIEVDADNESDAEEAAETAFVHAENINVFFCHVDERDAVKVELLRTIGAKGNVTDSLHHGGSESRD
jgi:hypothetical protein